MSKAWHREACGEQHGDQFEAGWNCDKPQPMQASTPNRIAKLFFKNSLLLLKLFTCFVAASLAYGIAIGPFGTIYNPYLVLFLVALLCLVPTIRWTAPAIILGFCVGPNLFAPSINGSGAQDINGAIIGAVLGLIIGVSMELGVGDPKRSENAV